MATNKNATIRYQALDRCFRNPGRNYYLDDLIDACNSALMELDPSSTGIKRRQIFEDIKFMKDSLGFNAPIESLKDGKKAYYRYDDLNFSINNQPLNEKEAQQLKEALMTLSRFKGMPQFEWIEELKIRLEQSFHIKSQENIISFDENEFLKGREFIGELYQSIINHQPITIQYKPFRNEDAIQFEIHPYHLRQYNNRWFLFGLEEKENQITNIALDRIVGITSCKIQYQPNMNVDFSEYFDDVVGVTIPENAKAQKIILNVDQSVWPYIKTKPLHGSQKYKGENEKFAQIEISVIPNYELESLIFSHGEKIEIAEPEFIRNIFKERIKRLAEKYKTDAD